MAKHWTLAELWNRSFEVMPDEVIKPRNYLHASELGTSFIEVYYKLRGTPYTNTFTVTNRRKMEAGRIFEGIVRLVLQRAGILKAAEINADYQLPGCLEVHGRLDFLAGGKVDVQQADECTELIKLFFDKLQFPRIYQEIADKTLAMVRELAGKNNVPLQLYILELKSVSDFVYRLIESSLRPLNYHRMQNYHYLLSKDMPLGKVTYINRDDVRLMEKKVKNDQEAHAEYKKWVEAMTDHAVSLTPPPKEPLVVFYPDTCSFNKNTMGVEWCKYLTKIYGFETPEAYREYATPLVKRWNYVYDRCVNCATMTADNMKVITEVKALFPDWDELVDKGKFLKVKRAERTKRPA